MTDVETLLNICKKDFVERQQALLGEIMSRNKNPLVLEDGTLVIPSKSERPVSLVAHYDNVSGSFGYNDNGMSIVAILGMLDHLMENVEVVFTNGEECGSTGAKKYLSQRIAKPLACVNLDVCGYGDTIYLDEMNSTFSTGVSAVRGAMPWNDGRMFERQGIPSVCVSTSYGNEFNKGIGLIWKTIHNQELDNRVEVLNFDLLPRVRKVVDTLVQGALA